MTDRTFECPHCLFRSTWLTGEKISSTHIGENREGTHNGTITWHNCPSCGNIVVYFEPDFITARASLSKSGTSSQEYKLPKNAITIYPKLKSPPTLSEYIPDEYRDDFLEAYNVLDGSPKASAALSRRCLQRLLRDKANIKPGTLSSEIDQTLGRLPSELRNTVDAIRNFGNFAAHPDKNIVTGDILDVELQEAEWTLEILKELLNFYIVKPAELIKKQQDLNTKLKNAGKNPMKS